MALAEIGSVGGFFVLRTGAPGGAHVPLAQVYEDDHAPLTARVDRVAARLRAPERRIAASVAQLGLAARLWSIALGGAVLAGAVPDLDPRGLYWDPDLTSPDDLVLTGVPAGAVTGPPAGAVTEPPAGAVAGPPAVSGAVAGARALPATAASVREVVQYGHLVPLAEALRRDGRISPRLLWGNAGSALAGAVRELSTWGKRNGRPGVAERAGALAAELFGHPDLRATGATVAGSFRRRSCCLHYRCPAGGLCGDCVFDRPPSRSSVQAESG
ncbi:(2Fe-2S)-binding protein [Streptomyces sp. NPDC088341]|uniref:(2Fe-2S)-binding protein n=1 Tax=Streptomyces sp. NPDC088341 TaxID=3154870 RepID=UPI003447F050